MITTTPCEYMTKQYAEKSIYACENMVPDGWHEVAFRYVKPDGEIVYRVKRIKTS